MTSKSDEIRDKIIDKMGKELGERFLLLHAQLSYVFIEWDVFKGLFLKNKERVDVLNEASKLVTYCIHKSMLDSVILAICRFSDPAKTGKGAGAKLNLSLANISDFLEEKELKDAFADKVKSVQKKADFARKMRNKKIAHADLKKHLDNDDLDQVTQYNIDNVLSEIAAALNIVNKEMLDTTTFYEDAIRSSKDEKVFITRLFVGNQSWDELCIAKQNAIKQKDYKCFEKLVEKHRLPWELDS